MHPRLRAAPLLAVFAALLALTAGPAPAREADHERALRAVQAGEVLPLPQVLERLARTHPGQVMDVALEREDGRWRYEIRLMQADGRLARLELDARTGELLRIKSSPAARH